MSYNTSANLFQRLEESYQARRERLSRIRESGGLDPLPSSNPSSEIFLDEPQTMDVGGATYVVPPPRNRNYYHTSPRRGGSTIRYLRDSVGTSVRGVSSSYIFHEEIDDAQKQLYEALFKKLKEDFEGISRSHINLWGDAPWETPEEKRLREAKENPNANNSDFRSLLKKS